MKDKLVILGVNGQLGTALSRILDKQNIDYLGLDFPEINLNDPKTYKTKINFFNPDIIINCSAYTNVGKAETDIDNAIKLNGTSLRWLINICNQKNIYLVHISTDYVFSGEKGDAYIEQDKPDPINIYGLSKYIGERIIQLYSNNYAIVRTAALYGDSKLKSTNVVKKLISLANNSKTVKLVNNEFTSPTFAGNLAEQIMLIVENRLQGIIHGTSEGVCNWVDFGKYLFKVLNINIDVEEVNSSYFNKDLKKPQYSVLENAMLTKERMNIMLNWKDAIKSYLKR